MDIQNLTQNLLQGQRAQERFTDVALSPGMGGLANVIASFRARRQASRNENLAEALKMAREERRGQLVESFPERERQIAGGLSSANLENILARRLDTQPERRQPLSPEGKLQSDIKAGFVKPETVSPGTATQPSVLTPPPVGKKLTVREKEREKALGKLEAGEIDLFKTMQSNLPELLKKTEKLKEVGKKATFTLAGRGKDFLKRQAGITTEGGKSRKEFQAIVDNQILPLLKQTFGAAFTVEEGESLRKTLGDPNATPEEKNVIIDTFIQQKIDDISSKARKLGIQEPAKSVVQQQTQNNLDGRTAINPQTGERLIFKGGQWQKI